MTGPRCIDSPVVVLACLPDLGLMFASAIAMVADCLWEFVSAASVAAGLAAALDRSAEATVVGLVVIVVASFVEALDCRD